MFPASSKLGKLHGIVVARHRPSGFTARSMDAAESDAEKSQVIERRAMARAVCDRVARIRSKNEHECDDEFARVRDISASGLCLVLERQLDEHTLLAVEPLHETGAKTLLVRVLWATRDDGGWMHECVLPNRLSNDELALWVNEQTAESLHEFRSV